MGGLRVTNSTIVLMCLSVCPSICLSVCPSVNISRVPLCVDQISETLPFTLDNDFYRQLRCHRCASNLLFWPWHFSDLSKRSRKINLISWMGATLCGPDLRNFLPFTLDNDLYRQLRYCRCASNLLYWLWHFFDLLENFDFSTFRPWTGATLCGPDLRNCLPFTLDNDFYRQLRCRRCASNLLVWPWHFFDLQKRSRKTFIFQLNTLNGYHFVVTRSQKLFAIHITQSTTSFTPPTCPFTR